MRSRSCAVKDATAWSACRFVDALCQMGASALDSLDSLARGGKLRSNMNDRGAAQQVVHSCRQRGSVRSIGHTHKG